MSSQLSVVTLRPLFCEMRHSSSDRFDDGVALMTACSVAALCATRREFTNVHLVVASHLFGDRLADFALTVFPIGPCPRIAITES
jgi:hypothetical protein